MRFLALNGQSVADGCKSFPLVGSLAGWLAVLIAVPLAAAERLEVVETDQTLSVRYRDRLVTTYNKVSPPAPPGIAAVYRRSGCLHPVNSPSGRTVTQMFPADHPHQHGIFSAWVRTTYDGRQVDFWNLAGGTGRVLHERVVATSQTDASAGFVVDLLHRVESSPPVDVVRERWSVTVHATAGGYHCFDLVSTQTALTDKPLVVEKYHYGGMALRGPTRWLTDQDRGLDALPDLVREPSEFMNAEGSERRAGNHQHTNWVALTGTIEGRPVTISVLGHPANFRAPQAARLHPTKPYFCFSPCVDGPLTIDREHPLAARYRYLVTDAPPDPAWISEQWKAWVESRQVDPVSPPADLPDSDDP